MKKNIYYRFTAAILILLSISSFFIGFIYEENSAGAGGLILGDFPTLWKNLQIFLNNDITTALNFTNDLDSGYKSSRTPLLYILHAYLNPFVENKVSFFRSVFIISLTGPILFYFCLKQKFKGHDNLLLILVSSILFLSPYFRTSSYWGLEENFSIISLLFTFLFFDKFLSNHDEMKDKYLLFLTILFSSLCLYFDQKFIIIPVICFFTIIFSSKSFTLKIFSVFLYFIFSLPYIYLILLWGNIIPSQDAGLRGIGDKIYLSHIGYASTIISFYLFPLLFFKKDSLFILLGNFFKNKKNLYFLSLFFIYLLYLLIFYDYDNERSLGKGIVHKTAILFFQENYLQRIYIFFSFFISWLILLIYLNNNLKDKLIIIYFFLLSIIGFPILQEYFDPLIILMAFTFFGSKLFINYKNSIFLFIYLSILLISSNIYYYNLIN